jgi:hypothetical protein
MVTGCTIWTTCEKHPTYIYSIQILNSFSVPDGNHLSREKLSFWYFFVHGPQRFYTPTSFGDNKSVRHRPAWTTARTATPMGTARGRQHGPVAVQAAGRHGASEAAAAYPNVALPGSKGSWMGLEGETQLSISIPCPRERPCPSPPPPARPLPPRYVPTSPTSPGYHMIICFRS